MGVGVLIISHDGIGSSILDTATRIYGNCPLDVQVVAVAADADIDHLHTQGLHRAEALDSGAGVLVLSDLYGSTPGNLAVRICAELVNARCVSGLSLAMLVRILNYPDLPLEAITEKAISGGRDGIVA